jgi:hypothetical protein
MSDHADIPTDADIARALADFEAAKAKAEIAARDAETKGKIYAEMQTRHMGREPDPLHASIQAYFATEEKTRAENAALRAQALDSLKGVVIPADGPSELDRAVASANRSKARRQAAA